MLRGCDVLRGVLRGLRVLSDLDGFLGRVGA